MQSYRAGKEDGLDILSSGWFAKVVRQAGTGDHRTDYVGEFVYQDGALEFFSTPDGRCVADGGRYRYEYHYRDHLGNLRLAFSDLDGDGDAEVSEVLQEAAYYPYGMRHEGLGTAAVGSQHRFLFQGKELERDFGVGPMATGWMDFGARRYDAQVGRGWGVDALAGKYAGMSPYEAFGDDPLYYVDPGGESLKIAHGLEFWFENTYYPAMASSDRSQIDILKASDVTYNIKFGKVGKNKVATSGYNFETKEFDITLAEPLSQEDPFQSIPTLGDELQHAFQYETGAIAFFQWINGGVNSYGYDVDDELESQDGAWRAVYQFIMADNQNFTGGTKEESNPIVCI